MRNRCVGVVMLGSLAIGGCTSLNTASDVSTSSSDVAVTGIPYSLPTLQYEVRITRTLAQCVDPNAKATNLLKFAMTVEVTPHYVAGETYVIDYRKLSNLTKISSLAIEYQEKSNVLKSVNASVEDRSAEIIGNVVKTTVGIASLAGGIPLPAGAKPADGSQPLPPAGEIICAPKTAKLLDDLKLAAGKLKLAGDTLKKATAAVEELSARAASLSDGDKATLTKRVALQAAAIRSLASAQEAFDEAKAAVSFVTTLRWPRNPAIFDEPQAPDPAALVQFARLLAWKANAGGSNAKENGCESAAQMGDCLSRKLTVLMRLDPLTAPAPQAAVSGAGEADAPKSTGAEDGPQLVSASANGSPGIFVRPPVSGRLLACANSEQGSCGDNGPLLLLRADDIQIPQLGTLRFLPFRNAMFQNNALVLTLSDTGNVAKFEYRNLKASGETGSAAALSAINDIRGYADARASQREKAAKDEAASITATRAADLATIQYEIDSLQKKKLLADLTQPPALSATAVLQAQTAEIDARIAYLKAQLAERQAQAALNE